MNLKKYHQIFLISWESGFIYRLNFIMRRLRVIIQILAVFFLWNAILKTNTHAFGYSTESMLTYILGVSFIRSVVFASKSDGIHGDIGTGDLNNHLLRPINYFGYWFSQDLADKLLSVLFSVFEVSLLLILLKPPLLPPASFSSGIIFIASILLGMIGYFFFSLIISLTTFWMPDGNGWPQRFFVYVMLEFLSGGLFPLDIVPQPVYRIISLLPTNFFLNQPLQIYLGRTNLSQNIHALFMSGVWIMILYFIVRTMFKRGIKIYGAYGR